MHETLRDLVHVFDSLADNAQAFMDFSLNPALKAGLSLAE